MPTLVPPSTLEFSPDVLTVCRSLHAAGGRAYLVGGCLRDALLGQTAAKDVDIEVFGLEAPDVLKTLQPLGQVNLVGRSFGVLKLKIGGNEIDVSLPRQEQKRGPGHRGFLTHSRPDLSPEQACQRRDLTINALLFDPLERNLLDFVGGLSDLQAGILRHVSEAFSEDPLRALRLVQLGARLEFDVAEETRTLAQDLDLDELPKERIFEELRKLLLRAERPSLGLDILAQIRALRFFPALRALAERPDDWKATSLMLDGARQLKTTSSSPLALMLSLLCYHMHELALPFVEAITEERKLLNEVAALLHDRNTVSTIIANDKEMDAAIRRLSLRVSLPLLADLLAITADEETSGWLRAKARDLDLIDGPPVAFLRGRDLLAIGFRPGKLMGSILDAAYERQIEGSIQSKQQALDYVRAQRPPS